MRPTRYPARNRSTSTPAAPGWEHHKFCWCHQCKAERKFSWALPAQAHDPGDHPNPDEHDIYMYGVIHQ